VVFGGQAAPADTLQNAHVQIEGEIRPREYTEKAGAKKSAAVKKSITEIRVFRITQLDRATKSTAEGAAAQRPRNVQAKEEKQWRPIKLENLTKTSSA
jgi:hypothetical protein